MKDQFYSSDYICFAPQIRDERSRLIRAALNTPSIVEARKLASKMTKDEIDSILDPLVRNYILNLWEAFYKKDVLESLPFNISIPIADLCNARCSFCDSWLRGKSVLKVDDLEYFTPILQTARIFGIQGHGEPLVNPFISDILDRISEVVHPTARGFLITNGVYLKKHLKSCLNANITEFNISLNAASQHIHEKVMGLGNTFDQIIDVIKEITFGKIAQKHDAKVNVSFVLTSENIEDLEDFILLSESLNIDKIYIRTLLPLNPHPDFSDADDWKNYFESVKEDGSHVAKSFQPGLNYHLLHPSLNPNFDKIKTRALSLLGKTKCEVEVDPSTWDVDILPSSMQNFLIKYPNTLEIYDKSKALKSKSLRAYYKDLEFKITGSGKFKKNIIQNADNPLSRKAPMDCGFVYHNLIVNETNLRMVPCCNLSNVPGHESIVLSEFSNFIDAWNSPAMVSIRKKLKNGPIYDACKLCSIRGLDE